MKKYVRVLALAALVAGFSLLSGGCDQNEVITEDTPSQDVVGKGSATADLGQRLAADPDFQTLKKLLFDADLRARRKYVAGANLKHDLAFAKLAEKKQVLSASDKSRLARIRGLSEAEFRQVDRLRTAILGRFPEIAKLPKEELLTVLSGAGVGKGNAVGKMFDKCSDCYYAYNTCISNAEFRHAVETMSCILLVESLFGGTACYLASLTRYFWSISMCNSTKDYCLSSYDCLATSVKDTL